MFHRTAILMLLIGAIFFLIPACAQQQSPILRLIAHRGGVVSGQFAENSPASLEEAVRRGYWMIEVDVRESKDGKLVVHHDPDFKRFYGVDRQVAGMSWSEIAKLRAEPGNTRPMTFREVCERAKGRLRLMIDTKLPEHSDAFYLEMESALRDNGLLESAYIIGTEESRARLKGKARISARGDELRVLAGKGETLNHYFVFEWGNMSEETVRWAQARAVPVVPSINTFHYGEEDPMKRGEQDIRRLRKLGVTEFQIDSVYDGLW
jgi:glycerophosphoryl diester phosphodiesterase